MAFGSCYSSRKPQTGTDTTTPIITTTTGTVVVIRPVKRESIARSFSLAQSFGNARGRAYKKYLYKLPLWAGRSTWRCAEPARYRGRPAAESRISKHSLLYCNGGCDRS